MSANKLPFDKMNWRSFSQQYGRISEQQVALHLKAQGFHDVRKVPDNIGGCDFIAVKNGIEYYIEVKTGNAKLSKKQKEMQALYPDRYILISWKNL